MDLRAGTIVDDRYELVEPLGELGPGAVWRARDPNVASRTSTLTLLGPASSAHEEVLKALRRLRHPGVVPVLTQGVWEGRLYVVQGPIDGRSLRAHHSERARPPLAEVSALFQSIATAVGAAHAASPPVIHGGLTPRAVIVSRAAKGAPSALVMGFGLGPFADAVAPSGDERFTAPERATGVAPDLLGDVFALAMLLRWMLEESDRSVPSIAFPDGRRGRADVADGVWRLIERATHATPAERPPTVAAFVGALQSAWKGPPREPSAPPAPPPPPPKPVEAPPSKPVEVVVAAAPMEAVTPAVSSVPSPPPTDADDTTDRRAPVVEEATVAQPRVSAPMPAAPVATLGGSGAAPRMGLGGVRLSAGPPVPGRRVDEIAPAEPVHGEQTVRQEAVARRTAAERDAGSHTIVANDASFGGAVPTAHEAGVQTVALEVASFAAAPPSPSGDARTIARAPVTAPVAAPVAAPVRAVLVEEAPTTIAPPFRRPPQAPTPSPAPTPPTEPRGGVGWKVVVIVGASLALAGLLLVGFLWAALSP